MVLMADELFYKSNKIKIKELFTKRLGLNVIEVRNHCEIIKNVKTISLYYGSNSDGNKQR